MTEGPVRRMLVAVDFSAGSKDALRFGLLLADALGASVEVLHVVDPSDKVLERAADRPAGGDPVVARQLLRDFIAATRSGSVSITERVEVGHPPDRIVSVARDDGFDLIVMGTLGRTGRPLTLVGSVAESVVRTASCPVLTVPERAKVTG